MADPKELADQAFALLQDLLRESEARAAELQERLDRRSPPQSDLEARVEVLRRQLEEAETERATHKRDLDQLEEVLAEERAKSAQLKAKLDIAESGPDKLKI